MKLHRLILTIALAAGSWPALAAVEGDDAPARLRSVEGGVALQRAEEQGAEEAQANVPFLPGDRLWSDGAGRVEVQFAEGSVLRLDRRSKLDYVEHDARRNPAVVTLSLWSGNLILHVPEDRRRADFLIETPDGRVDVSDGGRYRLDVDDRETRLLVFEGQARLEGERSELVEAGERSSLRRDEAPTRSRTFDEWEVEDDFARWDAEQGDPLVWRADSQRYLPEELSPYAGDFDRHGSWYYEVELGYVWRPQVAIGWSPYSSGQWVWTAYGWTWAPSEPWGWAPFHYGRWGHAAGHGWYWIPGRHWGAAWVGWRVTPGHVGWCALGHGDQPVHHGDGRGHAVPRGQARGARSDDGWLFVPRGELGARDVARRRVALSPAEVDAATPLETARQRLGRDLRVSDASASPRAVRVRPTPGDSVPELRNDQFTTIPAPTARPRPLETPRFQNDENATARSRSGQPATQGRDGSRWRSEEGDATRRRPAVDSQRLRLPERRDDSGSTATRERGESTERARARRPTVEDLGLRLPDESARRPAERETEARTDEPAARRTPPAERDVLRRFFGSLDGSRDGGRSREQARPRERSRDAEERSTRSRDEGAWRAPERAPRSEAPRQASPRREAPRPETSRRQPPPKQDQAQPRPPRDRDR